MFVKIVMDAKELKKFITAISAITEETPIMFDQDGLRIETLDPSHVSMISAKIPKMQMAEYQNDGFNCFVIEITDLAKFCKNLKGGVATITATADNKEDNWVTRYTTCYNATESDLCGNKEFDLIVENGVKYQECTKCKKRYPLELFKSYDNIKLVVSIENGSRTEISIEGHDYQYDYVKYPYLKQTGRVVMSKKELLSTVTNFNNYDDHATFIVSNGNFDISNAQNIRSIYSDADPLVNCISGSAKSGFNLSYFKDFLKGVSSKDVELNLTEDAPISIKDTDLDIEYILAPRITRD